MRLKWVLMFVLSASLALAGDNGARLAANLPILRATAGPGFQFEDAFRLRFDQPVAILTPPNDTRLFVVERRGVITVIPDLENPTREIFLNLRSSTVSDYEETGLLGVAFHPGYQTNGFFYVYRTTISTNGFLNHLSRFSVSPKDSHQADPASEVVMIAQPDFDDHHNGGDLHFGPDGYLYLSIGFGLPTPDQRDLEIRTPIDKAMFGVMIRIDVDQRPGSLPPNPGAGIIGNYAVPPDNPWVGATSFLGRAVQPEQVRTELYALGLRQPYRFSFDAKTGDLWLGDVGERGIEEIDLIVKGGHYGFPFYEGPHNHIAAPPGHAHAEPIHWYFHSNGDSNVGSAVVGGFVVRDGNIAELEGAYLFGDFVSGNVWKLTRGKETAVEWIGREMALSAFGRDPRDRSVLVANIGSGAIRRLRKVANEESSLPQTLSATGLFADAAALRPATGLVPFEINTPFWSDYAIKQRWFGLPEGAGRFGFAPEGNWQMPKGAVWVKHFDLELIRGDPSTVRRLETRVLIQDHGQVQGYTYRWNSESDAVLVSEAGEDEWIDIIDGETPRQQKWRYPARGECASCHTAAGGFALGFNTAQLNRPVSHEGTEVEQLERLAALGYLDRPTPEPAALRKMAASHDETQPLQHRVKSYLAANCAACHQPDGLALRMRWDARIETPMSQSRIVNGVPIIQWVYPLLERIVVPKDTASSLLRARISYYDSFLLHMPPLATSELNPTAISMLDEWIMGLPVDPSAVAQVGANPLEGSLHEAEGSLIIGGSGAALDADQRSFTLARKKLAGNGHIVAQISRIAGATPGMQFGLALTTGTNTLDSGVWLARSAAGSALVTAAAGEAAHEQALDAPLRDWLRLLRHDESISAWDSVDGENWRLLAETPFEAGHELEAGLFVTSGDPFRYATVEFSDFETLSVSAIVENPGPTGGLRLTAALGGQTNAASRVAFYADGTIIGESAGSPWRLDWIDAWLGQFEITAVAFDARGLSLTSAPVRVNFAASDALARHLGVQPAAWNWRGAFGQGGYSFPSGSQSLPGRAALNFSGATAQAYAHPPLIEPEPQGSTASAWVAPESFQFTLVPSANVPQKLTLFLAPYADTLGVRALIYDSATGLLLDSQTFESVAGGLFASWAVRGAVTVRIEGINSSGPSLAGIFLDPLAPPSVRILPPPSPIVLGRPIRLTAEASAEGREIQRVEFWAGDEKIGEDNVPPYEAYWRPLAGAHQLRAWAVGAFGFGEFSAPVTVTCALPSTSADFVRDDRQTQGDWIGNYGAHGQILLSGWTNLPPALTVSVANAGIFTFTLADADRATLQRSVADPNRFAGCYYSFTEDGFDLLVRVLDGQPRRMSIYALDYLSSSRDQEITAFDAVTNERLGSRRVSAFHGGSHSVWNIRGQLRFSVRSLVPDNAVVSAVFFDPIEGAASWWWRENLRAVEETPAAWLSDPDGDGRPNLLEYAAGSDPLSSDGPLLRAMSVQGESFDLSFDLGPAPSDARIVLEASSDLVTWSPAQAERVGQSSPVIFRLPATKVGSSFVRLRAELLAQP